MLKFDTFPTQHWNLLAHNSFAHPGQQCVAVLNSSSAVSCPQIVQGWARSYQQRRPLLTKDVSA